MLQIKNLTVKLDKNILNKLSLDIEKGTIHAIMGPNGVGKSTLSKVVMGNTDYEIVNGNIIYNNEDISNMSTDIRSKKGIFLLSQYPTEIPGITNFNLLFNLYKLNNEGSVASFTKLIKEYMRQLEMKEEMLYREVNVGFSGGEKKKNEILQLKVLKPSLIILDELDSGLDVDSLNIICREINNYIEENKDTTILIITHYPRILNLIKPNYVHVLKEGKVVCSGDLSLALEIEQKGYDFGSYNIGNN